MDTSSPPDSTNTTASSSITLAWIAIAILALFTAYATYTAFKPHVSEPVGASNPITIAISCSDQQPVKIKGDVLEFENILNNIHSSNVNTGSTDDTKIAIDFERDGQQYHAEAPPFPIKNGPPTGPASMHLTQRLTFTNLADISAVLDRLEMPDSPCKQ